MASPSPRRWVLAALASASAACPAWADDSVAALIEQARAQPAPPPPAASFAALSDDPDALLAYALKNGEPLDWSRVLSGGERVDFLGETHPDVKNKRELARSVGALKAAGVTHIALEMFGDDRQGFLDRYMAGDPAVGVGRIVALLKADWGWEPESYTEFLEGARRAGGFSLVALDLPQAGQRASVVAACGPQPTPECAAGARDAQLAPRDAHMGAVLSALLGKPGVGRVLVLAGARHVGRDQLPGKTSALGAADWKSFVFIDSDDLSAITAAYHTALLRRRYKLDRPDERVFLPTPRDSAGYDGFIQVPRR